MVPVWAIPQYSLLWQGFVSREEVRHLSVRIGIRHRGPPVNHDPLVAILKALVQGVHRFKTDQSFGESVIAHWTNTDDAAIVTASWKPFAAGYLQNKLYVTDAGIQTVLDELAPTDPSATSADPKTFYDNSLLQSLDSSGFFSSLGIPAGVN